MDRVQPTVLAGGPFLVSESLDQAIESWAPALNAVPAPVAIYDRAGTLVYRNTHAERLWTATQALPAGVGEAMQTGQPAHDRREVIERGDGSYLAIVVNADPLRDRAGLVTGAICCASNATVDAASGTEATRGEKLLRDSDRYLRDVLNSLPVAIYTTDATGKITFYNEAAVRLAGRRPQLEDKWSVTWRQYKPDGSALPHDQCPMAEALLTASPVRGREIIAERPDGSRAFVAPYPTPLYDTAGRLVGAVNLLVDLTEAKQREATLRESEQLFRRVFEQSPLGKAIAEADFRIISVNPSLCRMLGYDEAELIGYRFFDLVHPDGRDACAAAERALRAGEIEQIQLEERCLRKSGESVWASIMVGPIRDAAGRIVSGLAIIENIDDRKRMTEALLLSEQRLREFNSTLEQQADERARLLASSRAQLQAFFDNSPDLLTLQRVGGDGSLVYLDINPTCEIAYGLRRDQVIGRRLEEIIGPEAAAVPSHHIRECVRTGQSQRYVARRTMAGRTRIIDVVVTPVPGTADERGPLIISSARDITESEELEAQLRQAQKMEVVGQLTGGVAHDFNNLLTAILGNLELLEMRVAGDAGATRQVQAAQRSALRGAKLTEQLLAFSRRQHLRLGPVDVNAVLHGMSDLMARTIGCNVTVETVLDPDLWPAVADPTQLEIALLNLVINARDAMPDGGPVVIETRNVTARGERLADDIGDRDYVTIAVRDAGSGMSEEVLARAIEPFFTTKEAGKGSGLGLSQVYGVAQQSGGTLRIDSEVGQGTTVRIYLPRSTATAHPLMGRAGDANAAPSQGRILVVDDDADVREIAAQMLREAGYSVTEAESGEAALEILSCNVAYDLVVIDVAMPGLGGLETVRRTRRYLPWLRVLLMTGYIHEMGDLDIAGSQDPTLKKPFTRGELTASIEQALRGPAADVDSTIPPLRNPG